MKEGQRGADRRPSGLQEDPEFGRVRDDLFGTADLLESSLSTWVQEIASEDAIATHYSGGSTYEYR